MRKIHALPDQVIARIAAGEVIERPVYAVKELVENSLDAGASRITIQIEESGLKKIIVSDNGEGMDKDDLLESFKPHTTSKLLDESLIGIKTLGFRGEALASIAAVSDMVLQSRTSDSPAGEQVTLKAGNITHSGPIGMPQGTIVTVNNLFYTVPGRKKFLKSDRTEFRHIVNLITQYALSFPKVRFLLLHNKRAILDLPPVHKIEDRLLILFGEQIYNHLFPITQEDPYITIRGFIARPQIATRTNSKQYLFINNRAVNDRLIATAVKEAFGSLLENTQFPVFVFYLDIPYEVVDVNVHPRKEQVSFVNNTMIFNTVKAAVTAALAENNLTFANLSFSRYSPRKGTTDTVAAQILREKTDPWNVKEELALVDTTQIQQIHNTYLLVPTKKGLMLVDQHAAHERILYEQFSDTYKNKKHKSYVLPSPITLELPVTDAEVLAQHLSTFLNLGFEVHPKKGNVFSVNSIPRIFQDRDISTLIREIIEDLSSGTGVKDIDSYSTTMISFLACRAAIKAGERLTAGEAKRLIEKLENTKNNTTCPHGRPTRIALDLIELHKWFKRL